MENYFNKKKNKVLVLLCLMIVQFSFAQEKTISGTVIEADGLPLPSVNIMVKGEKKGVQTDLSGKYAIKAKAGDVLLFTFLGMKDVAITVGNSAKVDITMKDDDAQVLDDLVILGYTKKKASEVTGSSVTIKSDKIKDVPTVTVDQALQGKVAGLQISQSSGTPGSVQDIRIRGAGSITASNEPLYVIDGVPVVNSDFGGGKNAKGISASSSLSALSAINSKDIESITVLKDASATSAYGARGSNGVIVITTKSGKAGKTVFNVSTSLGFQNNAVEGLKPLTGNQRKELFLEALYNTYGASQNFTKENAIDYYNANAQTLDGRRLQNWNGIDGNWAKRLENKNATVQTYDISVSGGDEKSTFNASLGLNKTEATVVGADFQRISGALRYTKDLTERWHLSTSMNVSNSRQRGILEGAGYFSNPYMTKYFMSPWEQPYNPDGSLNIDLNTSIPNTLYTLKNNIIKNDLTRALSNTSLLFDITDKLKFKSVVGLDYNLAVFHRYNNRYEGDGQSLNGSVEQSVGRNLNIVTQNSLNYRFKLGEEHNFDVTGLFEFQKNTYNILEGYGQNIASDGLFYLGTTSQNQSTSSVFTDWYNVAYLGMFDYNFAGKYVISASYRKEGSSRFADGQRFGDFWSVGAAWNIHNEEFLKNTIFNTLRLRGSYGTSGNSSIGDNKYQALLSYDVNYADNPAIYPSQFGNNNLTWESNKTTDAGFEFGVLNNRISGSLAYYNKNTFDLLQEVRMSYTTGHATQLVNAGDVVNKGVEMQLDIDIFREGAFKWSVSGNYATVKNEVTRLAKDMQGNDINQTTAYKTIRVGEPINAWFMRKWAGVDPLNGKPLWYVNGVDGATTSNYNEAKQALQGGSPLPTYTGGFSTHFEFKGFFIDASLYFSGGNKIYENWSSYTQSAGRGAFSIYNGAEPLMNRWQQPGDITDVPKVEFTGTGSNAASTSTRFLYDGDYIRIKDLVFGYNFDSAMIKRMGFDGVSMSVRGTNLLTYVKDSRLKYDPEVRADGMTNLTTPPVKSVVFGLNLKF
ncbi:SusC/RagA family TonB-linked outer membrane protein [Flavobacterium sp. '19STA2R22 D10 B1']|uniref:SusC/RagA family TonB-linked outer membrane protein n=1 Tax=Flavobacterium aerium TaxID=3037261 RepID=UPI00278C73EA|nr:SusC/RagA family TonB-linked outer membrane protein [Flavobacterium sp. '19STA2R22 D10 B1']